MKNRKQRICGGTVLWLAKNGSPALLPRKLYELGKTRCLPASPLAKRIMLLAVISASSLLEICFFHSPTFACPRRKSGAHFSIGAKQTVCLFSTHARLFSGENAGEAFLYLPRMPPPIHISVCPFTSRIRCCEFRGSRSHESGRDIPSRFRYAWRFPWPAPWCPRR